MPGFQRIEHGALGGGARDVDGHLAVDAGEHGERLRQDDADHGRQLTGRDEPAAMRGASRREPYGSVWTSTDKTAGRSRTMGIQVSPASGET